MESKYKRRLDPVEKELERLNVLLVTEPSGEQVDALVAATPELRVLGISLWFSRPPGGGPMRATVVDLPPYRSAPSEACKSPPPPNLTKVADEPPTPIAVAGPATLATTPPEPEAGPPKTRQEPVAPPVSSPGSPDASAVAEPAAPSSDDDWLNAEGATAHLRFPSVAALYQFMKRHPVPRHKLGRQLRFRRSELDDFIKAGRR